MYINYSIIGDKLEEDFVYDMGSQEHGLHAYIVCVCFAALRMSDTVWACMHSSTPHA